MLLGIGKRFLAGPSESNHLGVYLAPSLRSEPGHFVWNRFDFTSSERGPDPGGSVRFKRCREGSVGGGRRGLRRPEGGGLEAVR